MQKYRKITAPVIYSIAVSSPRGLAAPAARYPSRLACRRRGLSADPCLVAEVAVSHSREWQVGQVIDVTLSSSLDRFNPLKYLLHSIFITLCKAEGRFCEGLEIDGHIVQAVEGPIALHGIDHARQNHI